MGEGRGGRRESSLPFSLPSFPFSPETPDTQAIDIYTCSGVTVNGSNNKTHLLTN